MRRRHFEAFRPACPACLAGGHAPPPLVIAHVSRETEEEVLEGILHCPRCAHEYPVIDGVPFILPDLRRLLSERGLDILLREDLDPMLESLVGDAIGPDSWFDATRSVVSTYAWDAWADLDPAERPPRTVQETIPGAARRCLARLLELAAVKEPVARVLDLGCGGGRTSFDLAAAHPEALVLGMDLHPGLLRLARRAGEGVVSYPRRRIGIVYDRRRFEVSLPGAGRVDFWACDALALPFPSCGAGSAPNDAAPSEKGADLCVALNLLDCVPDPRRLLEALRDATRPGGRILLATPYDWATRATPVEAWLGGHSQRAPHAGSGEAFLGMLLGQPEDQPPPHAIPGLARLAEQAEWPWRTRLHERASVDYRTHLVAIGRN